MPYGHEIIDNSSVNFVDSFPNIGKPMSDGSPLLKEGGIAMRYAAMTGDWQ